MQPLPGLGEHAIRDTTRALRRATQRYLPSDGTPGRRGVPLISR
jgi:hypothetical protein